jgi:putative transport protein
MPWLFDLFVNQNLVAQSVVILGLVVAMGLALGGIRVYGISLGISGVLFVGLAFGHFHYSIDPRVQGFARDFGLILFVYTLGLQVGPGFLASLRRDGLPLNLMAGGIVLLGVALTVLTWWLAGVELPVAVGMMSGATTNTPSLGAAQQVLNDLTAHDPAAHEAIENLPGLGYAVAYPFGVLGIILVMLLTRVVFRVDVPAEAAAYQKESEGETPRVCHANLIVTNPNLAGVALKDIPLPGGAESGIVFSRILKDDTPEVARPETRLSLGNVVLAVGPRPQLDQLRVIVGRECPIDLRTLRSGIATRRVIVSQKAAVGKTLAELGLPDRFGVRITRVGRAGIEMTATPGFRLQFGDTVLAVGEADGLGRVAQELGDSAQQLDHPQIVPLFLGIVLGVIVGSWPISVPVLPGPVRLGLAGGPLLVAIVLSRITRVGPLVWYMPLSANFMLRELGIALFLAAVGLGAGDDFWTTLREGDGLYWAGLAAGITLVPLLIVALAARLLLKLNYLSVCGLLAGGMTDPPALAFAHTLTGSEGPAMAYATVYPVTMILRVLSAQLIVLLLSR